MTCVYDIHDMTCMANGIRPTPRHKKFLMPGYVDATQLVLSYQYWYITQRQRALSHTVHNRASPHQYPRMCMDCRRNFASTAKRTKFAAPSKHTHTR